MSSNPNNPTDALNPDDPSLPEAATPSAEPGTSPTAAGGLSNKELDELRARAAKADEHWNHYLRVRADLDNYRKRATRERQEAVRYAALGLIEKLLPILDSFEMAICATSQESPRPSVESLLQGIAMIYGQLKNALVDAGLQEIDAAGQPFDPMLHEAVSQLESSETPEGHVLQQLRKGYRLHDRLVRPASVVVAKAPAA
jgi:molecular chaperone GrpE